MAGSGGRYVKSKNSNPFFDDDDEVDDDTFLKNARSPVKSPSSNSTGSSSLGGKLSGRNSFQHLDDDGESFASARKEPLTQEERLEQMLKVCLLFSTLLLNLESVMLLLHLFSAGEAKD